MNIRLSEDQKRAVDHTKGALLVVAGPGSGKTRVLTERIRRHLEEETGHFQILALTFTNKAANEMKDRLQTIPNIAERAFIGTLHSFCTEVLAKRGKPVGIDGLPQIFDAYHDRRSILTRAINDDPELLHQLKLAGDHEEQKKRIDAWLSKIIQFKSNLLRAFEIDDEIDRKIFEGYQAELRASGAVDFDDLLLLTYQLFEERPKIAGFYRRLYRFICIDEAQDLNGAQYGVLRALCGDEYKNVMMVGDKKQAIYGFNTADTRFMDCFTNDFEASVIELHENFRSSRAVVEAAKRLDRNYLTEVEKLPVEGAVELLIGEDEDDEAQLVLQKIMELCKSGHPDVEEPIRLESCAVLGRTRYTLLRIEEKLREQDIPYYKQLKAGHESESDLMIEFELVLRLLVNPKDRLHRDDLFKKWGIHSSAQNTAKDRANPGHELVELARQSSGKKAKVIANAAGELIVGNNIVRMSEALNILEKYGEKLASEDDKRAVLEDIKVMRGEWDRFLRIERSSTNDLASFLTHRALGTMQPPRQKGLALLTVHSSKGLEFDVIFVVGMSDGTFPDYRANKNSKTKAEEKRTAFVSVTRSKRLLYLSYPQSKIMPWGSERPQNPSPFLRDMELIE
ncbi:MAG: ATP-dependent helicase [Candidatus Desulforudis sp.]|nr:ATP-dependent helicase [Desulforudis sp.]MBV1734786.1 ATP-dependent helicase [Desulforudis sp.]